MVESHGCGVMCEIKNLFWWVLAVVLGGLPVWIWFVI